jgi:hypothetical protein
LLTSSLFFIATKYSASHTVVKDSRDGVAMDEELRFQTQSRWLAAGCLSSSVAAAVVSAVVIVILAVVFLGDLGGTSIGRLKVEGNDIVKQLEDYKALHGEYPADLPTAGISPQSRLSGRWHFSPTPSLTGFGLLIWSAPDDARMLTFDQNRGWVDRRRQSD